jgi:hypothetical protein
VAAAIAGADAVVNTVSAYVEKAGVTFEANAWCRKTAKLTLRWRQPRLRRRPTIACAPLANQD